MRILITGASGMIGQALRSSLDADGHSTVALARRPSGTGELGWDPAAGVLDPTTLEDFDAIVHLAGESIAGRWTPRKKSQIRASRIDGTQLLSNAIQELNNPPSVLVSASATGFYGERGDEECDESAPAGAGFLADVCRGWEDAAGGARAAGTRVVHARTGIVLSPRGGALAKLARPLKLGIGGPLGSGQQWWSWISLADEVRALRHLIETDSLEGPVNLVSPAALRNGEFIRAAGRVLRRPTILPTPAFGLRLMLGEMADALLLASTHVVPRKLAESGFAYSDPELAPALRTLFGR